MCDNIKDKIKANLENYIDIPADDWQFLRHNLAELEIEEGDLLIREGDHTQNIYFIVEGALRSFYTQNGKEKNYNFHFEDDWYAPYYSILTGQPSNLSVQALEPTTFVYMTISHLQTLYERDPIWERLGRLMAEKSFIEKEQKEERFRFNSAEEHYIILREKHPRFINRIPLYHLASYLDITPETLSRIRKRISTR